MKILFIYRNPQMGISIGKVFQTIEKEIAQYENIDNLYLPCNNYSPISLYKNIKYVLKYLAQNKYDIIHITGTEHYLLPLLKKQNVLITVHDLGFYTEAKKSIHSYIKYILWIRTLIYAKYVTFISEKSQSEALKLIKLSHYKVIHNPIDINFKETPKNFNHSFPRILHIGTKTNKNLINTINALKEFPCHLRIIGKLDNKFTNILNESGIKYSNAYNITNEELLNEYKQCDIVNFISTYEGFGMPIIEAQAIGRIVVTSNLSPMKEIANGAAILVDPFNPISIYNGYKEAIKFDISIIKNGIKNVEKYNVKNIAAQYLNLYKLILQNR